jgi:class 3 adenylate cyclase
MKSRRQFLLGEYPVRLCDVMSFKEFHYRWEYDLKSTPEELWPFVADTNRFNREAGVPSVETDSKDAKLPNSRRRIRLWIHGVRIEWEEQPFEWVRPFKFGVLRRYTSGPVAQARMLAALVPKNGGTHLTYEVWATPSSVLGLVAIPLQIGFLSKRKFDSMFRRYDQLATRGARMEFDRVDAKFTQGGRERLSRLTERLGELVGTGGTVERLRSLIENADDLTLSRLRPYALADYWKDDRREILGLCLNATRVGLLDLQWEMICPHCRGAVQTNSSLQSVRSRAECSTCEVDFSVNFDRSVELTFRPNSSIRHVEQLQFCMGGPEVTPHIVVQQLIASRKSREIKMPLEQGRYCLRVSSLSGAQYIVAREGGASAATFKAGGDGWATEEIEVSLNPTFLFENDSNDEHLFFLERTVWSDQAATAAEVTALQVFRDLFSNEALRPGEQISVGSLTVLFTDLRGSTQMYREIGDAPAFGRVMNHFDVLKDAIALDDGAIVKTIGDAVMAVFRRPASAVRAFLSAQATLGDSGEPLFLKGGIHSGHCIAVTLNDRLDYFGSTINMAARLEGQSTGEDLVISGAVYEDSEVLEMIESNRDIAATMFEMNLKGFSEEKFVLWRLRRLATSAAAQ